MSENEVASNDELTGDGTGTAIEELEPTNPIPAIDGAVMPTDDPEPTEPPREPPPPGLRRMRAPEGTCCVGVNWEGECREIMIDETGMVDVPTGLVPQLTRAGFVFTD